MSSFLPGFFSPRKGTDRNIFRHGSQGVLDTASHGTLDTEFGTHKEEDVVIQILEKGKVETTEVRFVPPHLGTKAR